MIFDKQKDLATVNAFKDILKSIVETHKINDSTVSECDKAIGDVRHYCEIQYPTKRTDKTKVCKLIHDYSVTRREAKDTLKLIAPLVEFANKHKDIINELNKVVNEMNKEAKYLDSDRGYTPRVLDDLFPKKKEE